MNATRRTVLSMAVLVAGGALPAAAQTSPFPSRPIRLIVPHAPGGNSDTFGRILAQKLTERVNQQVVVENRAGAGGTLGSALVAKSPADGYTLLVADNGTHAIAPTLYGAKLPYDVFKDFTPITLAAKFPTVIMIHPSVAAQNAKDFVALAKSQPGKLTYSSAGTGNGSHLTVELFRAAAGGLDMVHVPYKGGAPAVQALLARRSAIDGSERQYGVAAHSGGQGAGTGRGLVQALAGPARRADLRRERHCVLGRQLARHHGPGRHSGRRRGQAQPGDRGDAARA
jgi:tripartite-type tricarboxylate transporter receptor subunit TctC